MLLVKTVVRQSSIAGVGLFADEDINKGDLVWKYTPATCNLLTFKQFEIFINSFHANEKEFIFNYLNYVYYESSSSSFIECLDNGRYVNHSDQPNITSPSDLSFEKSWQFSVASRFIERGEEITDDYNTYDSFEWLDDLCRKYEVFPFSIPFNRPLQSDVHTRRIRFQPVGNIAHDHGVIH